MRLLNFFILCVGCLLTACGQTGGLYLPIEPEAAHRATLPQTLVPSPHKVRPQDKSNHP